MLTFKCGCNELKKSFEQKTESRTLPHSLNAQNGLTMLRNMQENQFSLKKSTDAGRMISTKPVL
jgi:uncharacterized UBP type Zn finger protein